MRLKIPVIERAGLDEAIRKYPDFEHVAHELIPYMHTIRGLYLHGSRIRGNFRDDSDYDLVLISKDKIDQDIKTEMAKHNVQLECFTLKGVKKQLELEPSYILTVLRQGVPLIGADLQKKLLRKKVNDIALLAEIDNCKKQLKHLKKLIREYEADDEDKTRIFFSAIMRLRRTYYIKQLYSKDVPPLSEDFKRYYMGDFEHIHRMYRKVRELLHENDENLDETQIPERIKNMSEGALENIVASVDSYIKDYYDELTDVLIEKPDLWVRR